MCAAELQKNSHIMPYKSRRYERADYFSDLMLFASCRLYRSHTDFLGEEKERKNETNLLMVQMNFPKTNLFTK